VKILSVITRLYEHCSTVRFRVLSLIVIPPGDYAVNRDITSETHRLLDALPGMKWREVGEKFVTRSFVTCHMSPCVQNRRK
jgi:hypothetical protein